MQHNRSHPDGRDMQQVWDPGDEQVGSRRRAGLCDAGILTKCLHNKVGGTSKYLFASSLPSTHLEQRSRISRYTPIHTRTPIKPQSYQHAVAKVRHLSFVLHMWFGLFASPSPSCSCCLQECPAGSQPRAGVVPGTKCHLSPVCLHGLGYPGLGYQKSTVWSLCSCKCRVNVTWRTLGEIIKAKEKRDRWEIWKQRQPLTCHNQWLTAAQSWHRSGNNLGVYSSYTQILQYSSFMDEYPN